MPRKSILILTGLVVCLGLAIYFIWPRTNVEVELQEIKRSPNGKWVAVVQLENYNTAGVVNYPVYAVRLKKTTQENDKGAVVMDVPMVYPVPPPSVNWNGKALVVTLAAGQDYQYFVTPVDDVPILVRRRGHAGMSKGSTR